MKKCPSCQRQYPDKERYCWIDKTALYQNSTVFEGAIIQNKYRVESRLGSGGMSTVFLVEHLMLHVKMAMKVMSLDCAADKKFRHQFDEEVRIVRQFQQEDGRSIHNFVGIIDVGETDDGVPYLIMEHVPGKPLSTYVNPDDREESRQPLKVARALKIAVQVCDALEVAHRHSVVHRDIKPENIMLVQKGDTEVVKVLDFGIAKLERDSGFANLSSARESAYSPYYCSPEQASGKRATPIDGRSDLYSLGVVLYEMLTGRQPFTGDTDGELLSQHLRSVPVAPEELNSNITPEVSALTMKAMAKLPIERFQSAAEMRTALEAGLNTIDDVAIRPQSSEYRLVFVTEDKDAVFTIPIGHSETIASFLDEVVAKLAEQGIALKYHRLGDALRVTCNNKEVNVTTPLRRQGIQTTDELLVRSVHVEEKVEVEAWIGENRSAPKMLELTMPFMEGVRNRFARILELEPTLASEIALFDRHCVDLNAAKESWRQQGPVAGLAAAEKLLQRESEYPAAELLQSRIIDELAQQIATAIDKLQLEDAGKLLNDIRTSTACGDRFIDMESHLQSEKARLEAHLKEATELVVAGELDRARAIVQSLRPPPQLRGGESITRILGEFETTATWVGVISELVTEKNWQQARGRLAERTATFRVWPPFMPLLTALSALESLQSRPNLKGAFAELQILDLRWAQNLNISASLEPQNLAHESLLMLTRRIVRNIGQLVESIEKRLQNESESELRLRFANAVRELAGRDVHQAMNVLDKAMAVKKDAELQSLRDQLQHV